MSTKKKYGLEVLEKRLGPVTLGLHLRTHRMRMEISQVEFAKKLKISKANLCDIEMGRKFVSIERAARFAKLLKESELLFVMTALEDQLRSAKLNYGIILKKVS